MDYIKAISYSTCTTANLLNASAIISVTEEGDTPIMLSNFRAKAPIFAITKNERIARNLSLIWNVQPVFTKNERIARNLSLIWNVQPVFVPESENIKELVQKGIEKFKEMKFLVPGDTVVVTGNEKNREERHASMVSFVMKVK